MDDKTIRLSDAIEALGRIAIDHKNCPRDKALNEATEALSALPAVEDDGYLRGAPPEPVANPSAQWLDDYAAWYECHPTD